MTEQNKISLAKNIERKIRKYNKFHNTNKIGEYINIIFKTLDILPIKSNNLKQILFDNLFNNEDNDNKNISPNNLYHSFFMIDNHDILKEINIDNPMISNMDMDFLRSQIKDYLLDNITKDESEIDDMIEDIIDDMKEEGIIDITDKTEDFDIELKYSIGFNFDMFDGMLSDHRSITTNIELFKYGIEENNNNNNGEVFITDGEMKLLFHGILNIHLDFKLNKIYYQFKNFDPYLENRLKKEVFEQYNLEEIDIDKIYDIISYFEKKIELNYFMKKIFNRRRNKNKLLKELRLYFELSKEFNIGLLRKMSKKEQKKFDELVTKIREHEKRIESIKGYMLNKILVKDKLFDKMMIKYSKGKKLKRKGRK